MTENEYRRLLIDTVRVGDYTDKYALLELLKISTLRFEKTMNLQDIFGTTLKSSYGTFNWTKAANYNKEHISIDKNHATAAAFADEFMKLKNKKVWNF